MVGTRLRCAIVAAACAVMLRPAGARADSPDPWHAGPGRYAVSAATQVWATMSDGNRLAADVYRPLDPRTGKPAPGRFPVVMAQTPYGKRSSPTTAAYGGNLGGDGYFPYLVRHGYVNVVADVRGTGTSDGDFSLFGPREMQDGVELVRWAARLPGTTGRVGLAGSSYLGLNQVFTAARIGRHSPLRAIVPVTTGNDLYRDVAFGGGIPNTEFGLVFAGLRAGTMVAAEPDDPSQDPRAVYQHPAQRLAGYAELDGSLYTEIDTGGPRAYEGDFWARRAPRNYLGRIVANGIPAMLVSGWFDVYQRGSPLDYAGLQDAWARTAAPADAPPMTAGQPPVSGLRGASGGQAAGGGRRPPRLERRAHALPAGHRPMEHGLLRLRGRAGGNASALLRRQRPGRPGGGAELRHGALLEGRDDRGADRRHPVRHLQHAGKRAGGGAGRRRP